MSTADIAIPPLGKMYLEAIWVETLIFGINCILFPTSIYILTTRRQTAHFFLVIFTCVLFALATAHAGLSLATLHGAFTDPALIAMPHGPDLYFASLSNRLALAKNLIYVCVVCLQDLLLIWRLYIVWGHQWLVCIVPLVLEVVHTTSAFLSTALAARPGANVFSHSIQAWGLAGWSLDIVLNTCVTVAIAGRLWWVDRRLSSVLSRRHGHRAAIFTVVESGGIFACATLVLFIMDVCGLQAAFAGIDPIVQVAVLTPLLLVVRVGLGITHGDQTSAPPGSGTQMQWKRPSHSQGSRTAFSRSTGDETTQYSIPLRDKPSKDGSQIEVKTDTFISV